MQKFTHIKRALLIVEVLAVLLTACSGITCTAADTPDRAYETGLFSWEVTARYGNLKNQLYEMIPKLGITRIYQNFDGVKIRSSQSTVKFADDLDKMGVDLFYLSGHWEYALDKKGSSMIDDIKTVAKFNKAYPDGKFDGIIFDVEPYMNDGWDDDWKSIMKSYVSGAKLAYEKAKESDLYIILCVPFWFDNSSYYPYLKTLVSECCDEIAVMNYDRQNELSNIKGETELAEKYGKAVTCIFEFQKAKKGGITDNQTYYGKGVAAAVESFVNIYDTVNYANLNYAYHYFKPLRDLVSE